MRSRRSPVAILIEAIVSNLILAVVLVFLIRWLGSLSVVKEWIYAQREITVPFVLLYVPPVLTIGRIKERQAGYGTHILSTIIHITSIYLWSIGFSLGPMASEHVLPLLMLVCITVPVTSLAWAALTKLKWI